MNTIYSGLFKLSAKDLVDGLVIAVLATVISAIVGTATGGVSTLFTSAFWASTGNIAWQAAALFLSKALITDNQGNVLGFGRKANQ